MIPVRTDRFGDSNMRFITIGSGICNQCRHVGEDGKKCKAFPRGIPAMVLMGEIDHRRSVPGDHGIQFEQRTGGEWHG